MSTTDRSARRLRHIVGAGAVVERPTAGSPQDIAAALIQLADHDHRPGAIADALLVAATESGDGVRFALDVAEACARLALTFLVDADRREA